LRCQVTPETARCLLGSPFADPLVERALAGEEEDEDDPNVGVFAARMFERLTSGGIEGADGDGPR
jgi:hypothetical protein